MSMDFKVVKLGNRRPQARSFYERFLVSEAVPIIGGFGVTQVADVPMTPWQRLGCDGAYLQLSGSARTTGMYVGRIAPGGVTLPEHHLYEKVIYILQGDGVAEIQQRDHVPQNLVWQGGSLFPAPMNSLHRLINHGDRPALFLAVTTAPLAFDHYRNEEFIFRSDFIFSDRYDGRPDYFAPHDGRIVALNRSQWIHQANFIPDVRQIRWGGSDGQAGRVITTRFEMAKNSIIGQLVEWPVGRYRKAHCRGGAVTLVILRSTGYSLMWPSELGSQPYKNGVADQVVRFDWVPGSIFSPPPNWFHQHFNTGAEPAQTLAFYCGGEQVATTKRADNAQVSQSGTLLEFNGDDPSIRRMYEAELASKGIAGR